MEPSTQESVAKSLEFETDLLEYIPKLLVDLWSLGSSPELIVKLLKEEKLDNRISRGLDLGCGKGAVSITLAKELGFHMTGVDAYKPFLEIAVKKAQEFGVTALCRFQQMDMRKYVNQTNQFDLVIYASIGWVLGDLSHMMKSLRTHLNPGGYIIIDDGYLKGNQPLKRMGYEHYRSHDETIALLQSSGDKLLREISTERETSDINTQYLECIKKRAKMMIKDDPQLKEPLEVYLRHQEQECAVLDENINGALWLLQKK